MAVDSRGQRWDRPWEPLEPDDPSNEQWPGERGLQQAVPIESVVPGELVENPAGAFYRVSGRHHVPVGTDQAWPDAPTRRALAVAANDPDLHGFDLTRALFIDTETTGLSGGTGTYAFIVGCGWLEDGALRVDQFFMRDQADEPALLQHLVDLIRLFDWVVSFNGAAFDLPLLRTRFIMNRMRAPLGAPTQVDLLHVARRLWRYRLADRSLDALERDLLGLSRPLDVPSYLIPDIYFRYLRGADARLLGPVFAHNRQDIVSLALLLERACHTCLTWRSDVLPAEEVLGVARAHALFGDQHTAAEAYARALELGLEGELQVLARTHLSLGRKRQAAWPEATNIWEAIAADGGRPAIWALVELAKYHEHRARAFDAARTSALRALELVDACDQPLPMTLGRPQLAHRLDRLERRLGAGYPGGP